MVCTSRCKGVFHNEAKHILAVKTTMNTKLPIAKMGRILYRKIKIGVKLLEIIILSTITITCIF